MPKLNNKGFAPVLLIAGIVVLVLTGAGGFYLYQSRDDEVVETNVTPEPSGVVPVDDTQTAQPNPAPSEIPDPYASWKTYTDAADRFSFKYPKGWQAVVYSGDKNTVYFGTDRRNLGYSGDGSENILCDSGGTDFPPQALITIRTKDTSGSFYSTELKGTAVTIDGKRAVRTRTVDTQATEDAGEGQKGFVRLTYQVKLANNKLMTIVYNQWPNETEFSQNYDTNPKNEKTFETIVLKTLDILTN